MRIAAPIQTHIYFHLSDREILAQTTHTIFSIAQEYENILASDLNWHILSRAIF